MDLGDAAYTLHVGREAFPLRLAVSCSDNASAISALEASQTIAEPASAKDELKVVFMFPGQGSQHHQMGYGLYKTEPVFRDYFDQCCDLLETLVKADLRSLIFASGEIPETENLFENATILQPSLFALEYSLAKTLMDFAFSDPCFLVFFASHLP